MRLCISVLIILLGLTVFADTYRCEVRKRDGTDPQGEPTYGRLIKEVQIEVKEPGDKLYFSDGDYKFKISELSGEQNRIVLKQGFDAPPGGTPGALNQYRAEGQIRTFVKLIDHMNQYASECFSSADPGFREFHP